MLFTTFQIGHLDQSILLSKLCSDPNSAPLLEEIVILNGESGDFRTYEEAVTVGKSLPGDVLEEIGAALNGYEVCMLLFTSGSTGNPKAASLTHQ